MSGNYKVVNYSGIRSSNLILREDSGFVSATKSTQRSLAELVEAHSEHTSKRIANSTVAIFKAAIAGFVLGPLLTVALGLLCISFVYMFGSTDLQPVLEDLIQAGFIAAGIVGTLAIVVAVYAYGCFSKVSTEIHDIKSEFKDDLRIIGGFFNE